jgi:high-affinity Fe2+/Pb2+ permease
MLSWSIMILTTKKLPAWLGWLGIVLSIAAAVIFLAGVDVNSLQGFRLFVTSIVMWIALAGLKLWTTK